MYLMYKNGVGIVVSAKEKGILFYNKSPFVDGKYIKVKDNGRESRKKV
jgi:hypothetical protein